MSVLAEPSSSKNEGFALCIDSEVGDILDQYKVVSTSMYNILETNEPFKSQQLRFSFLSKLDTKAFF